MAEPIYTFPTLQSDPASYATVAEVGTLYEVALAGQGLMLADQPRGDGSRSMRRQDVSLNPERVLDGSTTFASSLDRYHIQTWGSFEGGQGVRYADREDDTGDVYWRGKGVWPYTDRGIGPAMPVVSKTTFAHLRRLVSTNRLYAVSMGTGTDAGDITHYLNLGDAGTQFTLAGGTTPVLVDACSDGQFWYACNPTTGTTKGVWRSSGTTNPAATWSSTLAHTVSWAGQRICASYIGSGSSPNVWTTLTPAGVEEVASGRLILDAGWSIGKSTGGGGFVWFPAGGSGSGRSVIYRWQAGSSSTPAIAWELPAGDIAKEVIWHQGSVIVLTTDSNVNYRLWRCVPDGTGALTPFFLAQLNDATVEGVSFHAAGMVGFGKFVYLATETRAPEGLFLESTSLIAVNLSTGGWASTSATTSTGGSFAADMTACVWNSVVTWMSSAGTIRYVDPTDLAVSQPSSTNDYWDTPVVDKLSGLDKIWDDVTIVIEENTVGGTLTLGYTTDGGENYTNGPTWVVDTTTSHVFTLNIRAKSLGLRFTDTSGSPGLPRIRLVQLRFHPIGVDDQVVRFPVLCSDKMVYLTGRIQRENGRGRGIQMARWLESLTQSRVKFQDRDYLITGAAATTWEVLSVEVDEMALSDHSAGRQVSKCVAMVTLRKAA